MYLKMRGDIMKSARLSDTLKGPPEAWTDLKRTRRAPHLQGRLRFYPWSRGALIKSEFVNLPEPARYRLQIHPSEGKGAMLHHMPSFYPENGYAFFLFYSDQIRPDELSGQEVELVIVNPDSEKGECISSGIIQNKKSQQ